jgi:hypothetical protein
MAPLVSGFVTALIGFYVAFKDERPAFGVLVFAALGFMVGYAGGVGLMAYSLGQIQ